MKTIKIFISSTFRDMNAERDVIMKNVMPRLRELAEKELSLHVQEVDLRWGVTEEQARCGEVETLCLEGIEECRPYFLCLLGGRYGWIPAPIYLRVSDYQAVMKSTILTEDEKKVVTDYYHKTDDEQRVYTLDPRLALIDPKEAGKIQERLQQILEKTGVEGAGESITHKEINYSGLKEELPRFIKELDKRLLALPDDKRLADDETTFLRSLYIRSSGDPIWRLLPGVTAEEKSRLLPILKKAGMNITMHRFYFIRNDKAPGFYEVVDKRDTRIYTDLSPSSGDKLNALKSAIRDRKNFDLCQDYPCTWHADDYGKEDQGLYPITGLAEFEELIFKGLWGHIQGNQELRIEDADEKKDEVAQELDFHYRYIDSRTYNFCGRRELLAEIENTVQVALVGNLKVASANTSETVPTQTVMVVGEPGSGKSALLGKFFLDYKAKHPDHLVIPWFVGASRQSTSPYYILKYWCKILIKEFQIAEAEIPDNINKLTAFFETCITKVTRPVVIVLDAINQLDKSGNARTMQWLPSKLAQNVCIVTSLVEDNREKTGHQIEEDTTALVNMHRRSPKPFEIAVSKLSVKDKQDIVTHYLKQYYKSLSPRMLDILVNKEESHNPLYLQVALEELRLFSRHEELEAFIANTNPDKPGLPGNAEEMFAFLLTRIEQDLQRRHGDELAGLFADFMRYVAVGRNGMSEEDLRLLLRDWKNVKEQGKENVTLSPYLWGELRRWIRAYLVQRGEEYDFFHLQLKQAVGRKWFKVQGSTFKVDEKQEESQVPSSELKVKEGFKIEEDKNKKTIAEVHRIIAEYLTVMGYEHVTTLKDLPYHHLAAGQGEKAAEVMTEFGYHYKRLEKLGVEDATGVVKEIAELVQANLPGDWHERVETWQRFYIERIHLLNRGIQPPQKALLNLAYAYAATSCVTQSTERWLQVMGPRHWWMRSVVRPQKLKVSPFLMTTEGYGVEAWILPDGQRVLSWGTDGVCVWNIDMGKILMNLPGCFYPVCHPNGRHIVASTVDYSLSIWDITTGKCERVLSENSSKVECLAIQPDGRHLLAKCEDFSLQVWEANTGECTQVLIGHSDFVFNALFHPDGHRVISGSSDGTIRVWDLDTGECHHVLEHGCGVYALLLHSDGRRVVSGGYEGPIRIWDLDTGGCLQIIEAGAWRLLLLPDGIRIVAVGKKQLSVWNLNSAACLMHIELSISFRPCLRLHPDGLRVIVGSEREFKLVSIATGECQSKVKDDIGGEAETVDVHPDGRRAVCAFSSGKQIIWDLSVRENRTDSLDHVHNGRPFLSPNGRHAVVMHEPHYKNLSACVIDIEHAKCIRSLNGEALQGLVLHSDGRRAIIWPDGHVFDPVPARAWDLETNEYLCEYEGTGKCGAPKLHPDGRRLVWPIGVWDMDSGHRLSTFCEHPSNFMFGMQVFSDLQGWKMHIHPDGKRVVSTWQIERQQLEDNLLRIWDIDSGECLKEFAPHKGHPSVLLMPDGQHMVSWSNIDMARIWDIDAGSCLHTLGTTIPLKVTCSGSGKCVIFACKDQAQVWDVKNGQCLNVIETQTYNLRIFSNGTHAISWTNEVTPEASKSELRIWNIESGHCKHFFPLNFIKEAIVLPNNQFAIIIDNDFLRILDLSNGGWLGAWDHARLKWVLPLDSVRILANFEGNLELIELMPPGKFENK